MMYPSNPHQFVTAYPDYEVYNLNHLPKPTASGSNWGESHLQALRVLLTPPQKELPILEPYVFPAHQLLQKSPVLKTELTMLDGSDIDRMSHSELRKRCPSLGSFYVALGVVRDVDRTEEELDNVEGDSDQLPGRTLRQSQPLIRDGYVSGEGLGLSSSPASSPPALSAEYAPSEISDASYQARVKPEIATSHLAIEFLSHVLSFTGHIDNTNPHFQLEFLSLPTRFTTNLPAGTYTSINDGSLMQRGLASGKWTTLSRTVHCSLEAKASLQAEGSAELGKKVLAQWVGEMVGMVSQRKGSTMSEFDRTVFLVAAHQDRICFISTVFSLEYLDYLETSIEKELCFLTIYQSEEYNLSDKTDRYRAALSAIAMVQYLNTGLA